MRGDAPRAEGEGSGIDVRALREKYREERDKRLRPDGNDQYREVTGCFAHFVGDPYVGPGFERAPLADEVEVVVVGAGFGGLMAAARLRENGIDDFLLIDKAGDFGGTWYWNRYPGAQCDVESYIYLPLLEETGYLPREKYSYQPEIFEHAQRIGRHYRLYDNACFQTQVQELRWEEDSGRWVIATDRGDRIRARFVVLSNGPLNRPKLPAAEGIEDFEGHTFHTSRWDYAYTGGDTRGRLTGLRDKVVTIIGTGATAIQCVPHLGAWARDLYVFQRTPSSVDVRGNRPTDPAWASSLEPGWQKRRMENFNVLVSGGFQAEDLVNDAWTDLIRKLLLRVQGGEVQDLSRDGLADAAELADFEKMSEIRARVESEVRDPGTAEALKPWYRQFCKRPTFNDEYLATFNRPNVHLIDTGGKGVERITKKGVVANGKEHELDCLIFSTGFEVGTEYTRRSGYDLIGRGGLRLSEKWSTGVRTLHGMFSRGFPNCFIMGTAQTGFTANYPHMLDEQTRHIAHVLTKLREIGAGRLEASEEAERQWVDTVVQKARLGEKFFEECTPGYYNNEGNVRSRSAQNGFYGGGSPEFFRILEAWRAEGRLAGLEVG